MVVVVVVVVVENMPIISSPSCGLDSSTVRMGKQWRSVLACLQACQTVFQEPLVVRTKRSQNMGCRVSTRQVCVLRALFLSALEHVGVLRESRGRPIGMPGRSVPAQHGQ
eukprot:4942024-Pyramimonas_sp.AAC.1